MMRLLNEVYQAGAYRCELLSDNGFLAIKHESLSVSGYYIDLN
ncbi:hypothetical protein [Oceanisphaera avium]|nr:hypothetical protein [Oceanisphaera avium]